MNLRDDLRKTINKSLHKVYPLHSEDSFSEVTDVLLGNVWATLEDVIGTAQEQLFQQLTAVRTELDAVRRREQTLRDIVADLQSQLQLKEPHEESD